MLFDEGRGEIRETVLIADREKSQFSHRPLFCPIPTAGRKCETIWIERLTCAHAFPRSL